MSGEEGTKLSTCRDIESWKALHDASCHSKIENILSISSRDHFPTVAVRYHHNYLSTILLRKKEQQNESAFSNLEKNGENKRTTITQSGTSSRTDILPSVCIFCKKKYRKSIDLGLVLVKA